MFANEALMISRFQMILLDGFRNSNDGIIVESDPTFDFFKKEC